MARVRQIIDAVVSQLGTIDMASGYNFTAAEVHSGLWSLEKISQYPTLEVTAPEGEDSYMPDTTVESEVTVVVRGALAPGATHVAKHQLIEDITEAIHKTPTLGLSFVYDTTRSAWATDDGLEVSESFPSIVMVELRCRYESEFTDV